MAVKATAREFQIIGEALTQIRKIDKTQFVSDMKKIIGLRNLITHSYNSVGAAQLYGIVKNHLPILKAEMKSLLR